MEATLWDLPRTKGDFEAWDQANPAVWRAFERMALDLIHVGIQRYGAKAIMEVIRFHQAIQTKDPHFRINNNLTSYYARKFHRVYPEHRGFFETRKSQLDKE